MKRTILFLLLLISVFSLSGCSGSGEEITVDIKMIEMRMVLITGRYVLEPLFYLEQWEYDENEINERFGLELETYMIDLGYINEDEREVYLVAFELVEDAKIYEEKLLAETGFEGRLIYREAQIVVITSSQETIDLFK